MEIARIDKYNLLVDGVRIPATEVQEARLRNMSDEELRRFLTVMGH